MSAASGTAVPPLDGDIIIEMSQHGRAVKVTAICCRTGDEAVIIGDSAAPSAQLKSLAARKLRHMQKRSR